MADITAFKPVQSYGYDIFGNPSPIYGDAATYRLVAMAGAAERQALYNQLIAQGYTREQILQGGQEPSVYNNPVYQQAGETKSPEAQAVEAKRLTAVGGQTQAQQNIQAANILLNQLKLAISGKTPLPPGMTYLEAQRAIKTLETARQEEGRASGVSPNYGVSSELIKYQDDVAKQAEERMGAVNPVLAEQYGKGYVEVGGVKLKVLPSFQKEYTPVDLGDIRTLALREDIRYVSTGGGAAGMDYYFTPKEGGGYETILGKYSYRVQLENVIEKGGTSYVPGIGDVKIEKQLRTFEPASSEIGFSQISPEEIIKGKEAQGYKFIGGRSTLQGEELLFEKTDTSTMEVPSLSEPSAGGIKILAREGSFNVLYSTSGVPVAKQIAEELDRGYMAWRERNLAGAIKLDREEGTILHQALTVPQEIGMGIGLSLTKFGLGFTQAASSGGALLDYSLRKVVGAKLTVQEEEALKYLPGEFGSATVEYAIEPAKFYAIQKIFQAPGYIGEKVGILTGRVISVEQAASIPIVGRIVGSAVEGGAGNAYLFPTLGREVGKVIGTGLLIGTGALAGADIKRTDIRSVTQTIDAEGKITTGNATTSEGSYEFSYNPIRGAAGVITIGAAVYLGTNLPKWGAQLFDKLKPKDLSNPLYRNEFIPIQEANTRAALGVNTAEEVAAGKNAASDYTKALIERQKEVLADFRYYDKMSYQADIYEQNAFKVKADQAYEQAVKLQAEISTLTKVQTHTSIMQSEGYLPGQGEGIFKTTSVWKPNEIGRMERSVTSEFIPKITGDAELKIGGYVLQYPYKEVLGVKVPTEIPSIIRLLQPGEKISFSANPYLSGLADEAVSAASGGGGAGFVSSGGGGTGSRIAQRTVEISAVKINTVQGITSVRALPLVISPATQTSQRTTTTTRSVTSVKIPSKIQIATKQPTRVETRVATIQPVKLSTQTSIRTQEKVQQKIEVAVQNKIETLSAVRTQTNTRVQTRALVREQVQTRVQTRAQVRTQTRTQLKINVPVRVLIQRGRQDNRRMLEPEGENKRRIRIQPREGRTVFSDLLSIARSQLRYGAGTSPSILKRPQIFRESLRGGLVPTVEQLRAGGRRGGRFKF